MLLIYFKNFLSCFSLHNNHYYESKKNFEYLLPGYCIPPRSHLRRYRIIFSTLAMSTYLVSGAISHYHFR